jgi:hypothetical protein
MNKKRILALPEIERGDRDSKKQARMKSAVAINARIFTSII